MKPFDPKTGGDAGARDRAEVWAKWNAIEEAKRAAGEPMDYDPAKAIGSQKERQ
jgi:hypothetical protein